MATRIYDVKNYAKDSPVYQLTYRKHWKRFLLDFYPFVWFSRNKSYFDWFYSFDQNSSAEITVYNNIVLFIYSAIAR